MHGSPAAASVRRVLASMSILVLTSVAAASKGARAPKTKPSAPAARNSLRKLVLAYWVGKAEPVWLLDCLNHVVQLLA